MRVDAEHVRVALGDPDRLAHQVLEQLAAAALVVLALGVLHHGLVVDVGELHPDHRVARVAADVDLRYLPVPLPDLGQHDARLAARQRRPDRAVVERGQPGRGQLLQRRDLGRDRGQQQGLGQPVIGAERRGQPFRVPGGVLLGQVAGRQQDRPQLVPVQRGGRPEQRGRLRVQGIPAVHDVVEGVAHRDDVVHGQRVAAADQHLLHDLQRGPLPLHHAGQRPQRRHQRRRERVGQPERRLVRAPVPVVGVDPVQQHVPDVRAPVQPGERVGDHLLGLRVVGPAAQQPPVRHVRQVVVPQDERAEPPLLMPERPVQRLLLRAARARVGEPAAQVHLPGHERDQRDHPGPGAGLDQLGQLLRLPPEELPVLHREGQPQHQLVEEQHHRVVAQALGVRGHRRQPGVEIHVGGLLGVRAEVVLGQRGHQQLTLLRARLGGPGRRVGLSRPGSGAADQPRPGVRPAAARGPPVQPGEEPLVPVPGPQPLGVPQDGIGLVQRGQRRPGMPLGDLPDVARRTAPAPATPRR